MNGKKFPLISAQAQRMLQEDNESYSPELRIRGVEENFQQSDAKGNSKNKQKL